ncbi:MAG: HEPN domain-containing protein [Candidatus Brockarchaeota archaeon]|nr:HEPN domain-containing protein [Candidatus Brockarchaeota archaeon]MBO3808159.1 HEPN domain-containing protein [Candidatus Brockarchaeota archaeon]
MNNTTNIDLAVSAIRRSSRWLRSALRALEDGRWDDVVYSSQMAVEQASKSVLIALGIEYPKEHDVSIVFKQVSRIRNIPEWFSSMIPQLAENISELAELRGLAGYGYEKGLDADYFKDYAPKAYEMARKHYEACVKLLSELYNVHV